MKPPLNRLKPLTATSSGGDELSPATAADGAGREGGENHRQTLRQCDKEAEAAQRIPKEEQLDAGEERRGGRIHHVSPGQVPGIVIREELIAVKSVPAVHSNVEQNDDEAEEDEEGSVAEAGSRSVHRKGRVQGTNRLHLWPAGCQ